MEFWKLLEAVLLMVILCQREAIIGNNLRIDRAAAIHRDPSLRQLRQPPLFLVVYKDDGCILTGPALVRGVMACPEGIKQLLVGYLRRVIVDLDGFSMVTEIMVGGVLFGPARVPHARSDHACQTPEPGVWSPESTHGKSCRCHLFRLLRIDQRLGWYRKGSKDFLSHGRNPSPFSRRIYCVPDHYYEYRQEQDRRDSHNCFLQSSYILAPIRRKHVSKL